MWGSVSFKSGSGMLAVLGTSMFGVSAPTTRKHLAAADAMVITVGSLLATSLFLAPFAWGSWPSQNPSPRAWTEMAFLGVASWNLSSGFRMLIDLVEDEWPASTPSRA